MIDYRNLFGFAAILFGAGFFVQSLKNANAEIGPSISLGSNPIQHYYLNCDGQSNATIFTNNETGDFIITDIYVYDGTVEFSIDSNVTLFMTSWNNSHSPDFHLNSGIRIPSSSSFTCTDYANSPKIMVSGYYTHP